MAAWIDSVSRILPNTQTHRKIYTVRQHHLEIALTNLRACRAGSVTVKVRSPSIVYYNYITNGGSRTFMGEGLKYMWPRERDVAQR